MTTTLTETTTETVSTTELASTTSSEISQYKLLNRFATQAPVISIVAPVYNERENIPRLVNEILNLALTMERPFEVILVDDGSTDKPLETLQPYLDLLPEAIKWVELSRNYGQSAAMAAGLDYARGDVVVTLDSDLQNDPADIPRMVQHMVDNDLDMVMGWRKNRQDAVISRKIPSWLANRMIGALTGLKFTDYGCSLKVYRRDLAKSLRLYGELHRFIPFLASMEGAKMDEVPVNHRARMFGQSKYNLSRTLKVVLDLMSLMFMRRFYTRPLHMFGRLGIVVGGIGTLMLTYLAVDKLFFQHDIGNRPLLMLGALLIITSLQLISTGMLAEMMVHNTFSKEGQAPYKVRRVVSG